MHSADKVQQRIDANATTFGDGWREAQRDLLKTFEGLYRGDMDRLYAMMEQIESSLQALSLTHAELLHEVRALRTDHEAWRAGVQQDIGRIELEVGGLREAGQGV